MEEQKRKGRTGDEKQRQCEVVLLRRHAQLVLEAREACVADISTICVRWKAVRSVLVRRKREERS